MTGLDYVALRYFNVYGPRMDVHGAYTEVLVRWMERIADGEPPLIFGDGTQTMDFVCVPDIARANVLAAEADVTDAVFNIASGVETSLNELAETLLRVMGSDLSIEYGPERAVNGVTRRLADTSGAQAGARLQRRDRPRGGPDPARRVVAGEPRRARARALIPNGGRADGGPVREALVRRGGGRGRRRSDRLRLADPGAAGRGVRAGLRASASAPPRPSRRRAARPRFTSPSTPRESGPATRSSFPRSPSSRPQTPSGTAARRRSSPTSTRSPTTSTPPTSSAG